MRQLNINNIWITNQTVLCRAAEAGLQGVVVSLGTEIQTQIDEDKSEK